MAESRHEPGVTVVIPCLNERNDWIHALADIVAANLGGWVGAEPSAAALAQSQARAIALGAKASYCSPPG